MASEKYVCLYRIILTLLKDVVDSYVFSLKIENENLHAISVITGCMSNVYSLKLYSPENFLNLSVESYLLIYLDKKKEFSSFKVYLSIFTSWDSAKPPIDKIRTAF